MSNGLEAQLATARKRNADRLGYVKPQTAESLMSTRPKWSYSSGCAAFGMTADDYIALSAAQNDRCAICYAPRGKRALAIDHCHASGKVRGLLCSNCNTAIGMLKDDPERLRRAIAYLERD